MGNRLLNLRRVDVALLWAIFLPRWVERLEFTNGSKSFICSLNNSTTVKDYEYHNGTMGFEYSGGCACDEGQGTRFTVNKREQYEWVPSNCSLLPWNATQFCELLGDRRVLLTGDSTMHQTATTLMSMLHHDKAPCTHQVNFGLSHYLIFGGGANIKWLHHLKYERPLPDIVIMTVGAHLEDMGDLYTVWDSEGDGLVSNIQWLRSNPYGPHNFTFVWKTQNPGHLNCTAHSQPLSEPQVLSPDNPADEFHWHLHKEFDKHNKQRAKEHGLAVIDMSPLDYRADSHPSKNKLLLHKATSYDCLHYCLPGPLNLFAVLLLNKLYNKEI